MCTPAFPKPSPAKVAAIAICSRATRSLPSSTARLKAPDIRAQIAAGSLGRWLRPDRASFVGHGGAYLRPDPETRNRCRARYGTDRLNVGIAWHTTKNEPTAQRRIKLEELEEATWDLETETLRRAPKPAPTGSAGD